jgi:hypothetical protein
MKECLVFALMLGLTGMVVGQQSDSSSVFDNTRTDSSRVASPAPDSKTTRVSEPGDADRIMKLDIDSSMIDAIKQGQTLEASIDLKDVTNGIVMLFDDPTTLKPRVDEVPRNLKPDFVSGNGVLHFTLDEVGLERLRTEGLQYEYLPGEKGNYQKVSLKFVPSSTEPSGIRSPVSTGPTDFSSNRDPLSSTDNRDFTSNRRDSVLAGKSSRLGSDSMNRDARERFDRDDFNRRLSRADHDYASSETKTDADRYFEQQRREELDRQQQTLQNRRYGVDHSQDDRHPNWNSQRLPKNDDRHTFELTDQEIDALAKSTQEIRDRHDRREAELERLRLDKLAADRNAQRADSDRMRLLQELRDRTRLDQTPVARRRPLNDNDLYTPYGQRRLSPSNENLSRTASLDSQYDPITRGRYSDRLVSSDVVSESARLKLQEAALENERLRLELARSETNRTRIETQQRLADLGNAGSINTVRRSPSRMSDYSASIPGSQPQNNNRVTRANVPQTVTSFSGTQMTNTAVDHILRSYDGAHLNTNFDQVASRVKGEVAAISAAKTRVDKFNGFLLFLFITFFALSLYLGWLAQSFYGQYGELADELRETFTATT